MALALYIKDSLSDFGSDSPESLNVLFSKTELTLY